MLGEAMKASVCSCIYELTLSRARRDVRIASFSWLLFKANKLSKHKGPSKVEHAYNFL